jgi:hypothetical protein
MAFEFIWRDNTEEVDFINDASPYGLQDDELEIWTPRRKQVWGGDSEFSHGKQLISSKFENRRVKLKFYVTGATRDELAANVSVIERLAESARLRDIEQIGSRNELQYKWDGMSDTTYFEVIDAELRWPSDTMSVEGVHQKDGSGDWIIWGFSLMFTTKPFAFDTAPISGSLTEMSLTNGGGTNQTGGLNVYNHDDDTAAAHDNWVEIDAAEIEGEFPAVTRLILESDSGEAEKTSKIYIGVRKGDTTFVNVLEDDDADFVIGSPSPTLDTGNSSGDYYTQFAFSGTTEQALISWDLSAAQVEATQGPFRIFGRVKDATHWDQNANYAIAIKYGTDILWQGEWRKPVNTTTELFDFGTVYMPPWLVGTETGLAALTIEIRGQRDIAGTTTINFDFLALLPMDGGYRIINFRAVGMAQTESVVDDGWTDAVYHINTSSKKTGLPYALMPRIELKANTKQRIYFLMEGTAGNAQILRQLTVQVYIVPTYNVLA